MPHLEVGQDNSGPIELYYEDHGSGAPIVLIHGYPLSGASWEKQVPALLSMGHRVITYDRRGFGKSSQPSVGYDYNTFTEDLHSVITQLELRDVTLAGFSMGAGEVARYLGRHGSSNRISRAVFLSGIPPFLVRRDDNLEGVDPRVFEEIQAGLTADRFAFFARFLKDFYNADQFLGRLISEEAIQASWNVAAGSSATASFACVAAWLEDFRPDLKRVDVPTLVIHGDADRIVPFGASGKRTATMIPHAKIVVLPEGPHGIIWTHASEVNAALADFLG